MKAVIIGLGGWGTYAVGMLKDVIKTENLGDYICLAIDVDPSSRYYLNELFSIEFRNINASLSEYKKEEDFKKWWIPNYVPVSNEISGYTAANQIRINGRLALYAKINELRSWLRRYIPYKEDEKIYFFIVTSLGGGTGSGIFIDVAAILRNIYSNSSIYGFFIDGTVTQRLFERNVGSYNTLLNSYAALRELTHYLINSHDYSFYEIDFENDKRFDNVNFSLYDICFLYQDFNKNAYSFMGENIIKLKEGYAKLIVNSIYPMLGIKNFEQSEIGNRFTNAFGGLQGDQKQFKFTGAAVGKIRFDRGRLAEYFLVDFVRKLFDSDKEIDTETLKKRFSDLEDKFEKEVKPTNRYRKTIINFIESSSRVLENEEVLYNDKNLRKKPRELPIIVREEWPEAIGNACANYRKDVESFWKSNLITVKEQLKKFVEENVGNLERLREVLNECHGFVEGRIKKLEKELKTEPTIKDLIKSWNNIFQYKSRSFLGRRNPKRREAVKLYLKRYEELLTNELNKIDIESKIKFYEDFREALGIISKSLEYLLRLKDNLIQDLNRIKGKIQWSIEPFDSIRLQNREYPLEIKIEVNPEIIEKFVSPRIEEHLKEALREIRSKFYEGEGDYPGFLRFYKEILEKISSGKESLINLNDYFEITIEKFVIATIKERIKTVLNQIKIKEVLEWWIGEILFPQVKYWIDRNDRDKLRELLRKWEIIFGEGELSKLVSIDSPIFRESEEKVKERWVSEALRAFINKFFSYIEPFVKYDEKYNSILRSRKKIASKVGYAFKVIYCPIEESDLFDKNLVKDWQVVSIDVSSGDIILYSQDMLISLDTLDDYKNFGGVNIKEKYSVHIEKIRKSLEIDKECPETPLHTDVRFYTEWYKPIYYDDFEFLIQFLFITALGLKILMRKKEGRSQIFVFKGEKAESKLKRSLPEVLDLLKEDFSLREMLKNVIKEKVEEIKVSKKGDYNVIKNAYFEAYNTIKNEKLDKASEEGKKILKIVEFDPNGNPTSENKMPKDWNSLFELLSLVK